MEITIDKTREKLLKAYCKEEKIKDINDFVLDLIDKKIDNMKGIFDRIYKECGVKCRDIGKCGPYDCIEIKGKHEDLMIFGECHEELMDDYFDHVWVPTDLPKEEAEDIEY
jgi:tetrahydromethanopterin S-methyltransferase subunit G